MNVLVRSCLAHNTTHPDRFPAGGDAASGLQLRRAAGRHDLILEYLAESDLPLGGRLLLGSHDS